MDLKYVWWVEIKWYCWMVPSKSGDHQLRFPIIFEGLSTIHSRWLALGFLNHHQMQPPNLQTGIPLDSGAKQGSGPGHGASDVTPPSPPPGWKPPHQTEDVLGVQMHLPLPRWCFQIFLEFSPQTLGSWSNLTKFFQIGLVQPPSRLSFFGPSFFLGVNGSLQVLLIVFAGRSSYS